MLCDCLGSLKTTSTSPVEIALASTLFLEVAMSWLIKVESCLLALETRAFNGPACYYRVRVRLVTSALPDKSAGGEDKSIPAKLQK